MKLADVAKAAGVSQGTASNVFNRPEIVRAEVRDRVRAAARAIGYAGPDVKARALRAGKVNAIGVASADPLSYFFDDPYARMLMSGIAEACDERGAGLSLVSANNDERLAWNIQNALVDGFILFCVSSGPRLVRLTRQRRLPFVALELGHDDASIAAIGIDDVAGARLAARHLAELGHRRFAIVALSFPEQPVGRISRADIEAAAYPVTRKRLRGYSEVLAEYGIDANAIPIIGGHDEDAELRAGLEELFASPQPPTAILSMSDRAAFVILDWLAARGIAVPDDVSVVGFDGVPEGETSRPPLTTIAQPIKRIGRLAVETIMEHDGPARQEQLDAHLVVRRSTAPPKG